MAKIVYFLAFLFPPLVFADDLFTVDITVDGQMDSFGFSDVESVFDQIYEDGLEGAFPGYTERSMANAAVDYRGLAMRFSFEGSTTRLVFEVPALEIREMFAGANRDASLEMLEDYLSDEGDDILNRIQAALIETSPVDPIAGNPSSLMGTMVAGQFNNGFENKTTEIAQPAASASEQSYDPDDLFTFGARFGRYTASGKASNVYTLPLGYSFRLKESGRGLRAVDVSLPITYADIEGGIAASGSIGLSLLYTYNDRWSLSPAVGAGLTGSVDLGSAGGVGSLSLTSAYKIPGAGWSLSVGNMVGYYETLDIALGGYDFNPGVSNTVLRNALMVSIPGTLGQRKIATEVWGIDTRFFGSALYSEYYNEFGISVGLSKTRERSIENYVNAGVSYLIGDGVRGWRLNLGYSF